MIGTRRLWAKEESFIKSKNMPSPNGNELIGEVEDSSLAEFMIMELEAKLAAEEKEKGVFHYRWIRFEEG